MKRRTDLHAFKRFNDSLVFRIGVMTLTAVCFSTMAHAESTAVNMTWFPSLEPAVGASILTRHANSVEMRIHTTGLEPGHAYTVWWVIFNNPDACSDDCDEDDFPEGVPAAKVGDEPADPEVQASVLWAAGGIAGSDGTADFHARLLVGEPPMPPEFGPGLTDPLNAEIHLPVRSHGLAVVGRVAEQLSTINGMCNFTKPDPGSNKCLNVQVATHKPY